MTDLHLLSNSTRPAKRRARVGRGPGSGMGKTCCRGGKGASARSGYKKRLGYEGGQMRLHMKLPLRGFNNIRFNKKDDAVNLGMIDQYYQEGEVVSEETLRAKGFMGGRIYGIKILGEGKLTKRLSFDFDALAFSKSALEQLEAMGLLPSA